MEIQILWLFILALPVGCIAWTITHEQLFFEPREFCKKRSECSKTLLQRKFYYLFTCEYCFSFYVSLFFIILTKFKLLLDDWRGYLIAEFSLMWVANFYMSIYLLIRTNIKSEKLDAEIKEKDVV